MKKARTRGPAKSRAPSGRKGPDNYIKFDLDPDGSADKAIAIIKACPHRKESLEWAHARMMESQAVAVANAESTNAFLTFVAHATADAELRADAGMLHAGAAKNIANLEYELVALEAHGAPRSYLRLVQRCIDAHRRLVGAGMLQ